MNDAVVVRRTPLLACALLSLFAACSDGTTNAQQQTPPKEEAAPQAARSRASLASLPDFTSLVEEHGDAVVNVEVVQHSEQTAGPRGVPPPADDPLLEFFRRFGIPPPDFGTPESMPPARGAGSGFIVSSDGYILTNAHVVAEADEVTVRLTDRREFPAKVIGTDARTDVAVIRIDAGNLPTVRIGDPARLKPGQWVLAIGSPFGLENTATAGIVSATSRAVGPGSFVPFIQTDVAVNPGNSGGPLFNMQGEVVGINSMIFSRTGGYMGLSFAIPIDAATSVRDQLIKTGRVVRGRIGVTVQDVDAELAQSFGLDKPQGALVSSVEEDGPADRAGLRPGDVILSVNGREIGRFGELSSQIARMKPGSETQLVVWRNGKKRTAEVRIAELEEPVAQPTEAGSAPDRTGELGMSVRPLTREEKQLADTEGNLVVEQVGGAAAAAGIQPGDIIVGANGEPIESIGDLRDAVKDARETVALLIQRGAAQIFVPVRVK